MAFDALFNRDCIEQCAENVIDEMYYIFIDLFIILIEACYYIGNVLKFFIFSKDVYSIFKLPVELRIGVDVG